MRQLRSYLVLTTLSCLCAAFNHDVSLPDALHEGIATAEEFNTDFSSWCV